MGERKLAADHVSDSAEMPRFAGYHAEIEGRDVHFAQATKFSLGVIDTEAGKFVNVEISSPDISLVSLFLAMQAINARAVAASLRECADQIETQGSAVQ